MPRFRFTLRRMVASVALIACAMAAYVSLLGRASDCGNISGPWNVVRQVQSIIGGVCYADSDHQFRLTSATELHHVQLDNLLDLGGRYRILAAPPLDVRDAPSGLRRLVLVTDRPFHGGGESGHVAAYSDASMRLIPAVEFATLDRASLVPLDKLLAESE